MKVVCFGAGIIGSSWCTNFALGGSEVTLYDVAEEAFACHVSQQGTRYKVRDFGLRDNSLFGLYRSLVGQDVEHNDLFENITPAVRDGE